MTGIANNSHLLPVVLLIGAYPGGWTGLPPLLGAADSASETRRIEFVDITDKAGIDFRHINAATGQKYLVETMAPGCAFLDYDGDGYLDIYLVNGAPLPGYQSEVRPANALYKNNRDGTFSNVTSEAGVEGSGYGMGAAVGDYNNDGFPDLYLTNYGSSLLYRNNGDGTFTETAEAAGVNNSAWGAGTAFFDYDNDGRLDLYVANYVDFRLENNVFCGVRSKYRSYCHPDEFSGVPDVLYRNNGDGTFSDVGERAGIADPAGKGSGVVAADFNQDGYQDIYVANDAAPNFLYINRGDGTFEEIGTLAGAAYSSDGKAQSGMGAAVGDYDGDGYTDILATNLSNEGHTLYRREGADLFFSDVTFPSGVGRPSLLLTGWGAGFFDYDNDGDEDVLVANGHVMDDIELLNSSLKYLQPALLLENRLGSYVNVTSERGGALSTLRAGRGLALGDIDNDGDIDVLISGCNQRPALLRNEGGNRNHWLTIQAVGKNSNRDGIGVKVQLTAGGKRQSKEIVAGGSYLSSHDRRLHFGLGANTVVERVEIRWPSGKSQVLEDIAADRVLRVEEPSAGP